MGASEASVFLTAEWRWLAMLNWEIDPALLRSRIPRGTELDSWQGRTFVSVVGFRFLDTRLAGWPVPFHRDFDEVNLRFYVRRRSLDGWRRGVVFVREIVPRWAIAAVARLVYNENYVALPMRHRLDSSRGGSGEGGVVEYSWRYTVQRDGGTAEYRVEHVPWLVSHAGGATLTCDVEALYGREFAPALAAAPASAFFAVGSPVTVRRGLPLEAAA
jgi:hypothetical protein